MKRKAIMILTAVLAMTGVGEAQERTPQQEMPKGVVVQGSEIRTLHSEIMDQNFRLMIGKPFGPPPNPDGTYPVIYILDADIAFPLVRQIALSLQSSFDVPPALIVGIAYEGGFREAMTARTRDYTPTTYSAYAEYAARWEGGSVDELATGGAATFLRFVKEELKPFIESSYRANPKDSTIFGSSFGGLFAAYALLEKPDTFQRYIMSSPALWWDDNAIIAIEQRYAKENNDLSASVFIAAGGRERPEYEEEMLARAPQRAQQAMRDFNELIGENAKMVEAIELFSETLGARGYENLDLTFHIFPDDTHASTPPLAITRGLRVVFGAL